MDEARRVWTSLVSGPQGEEKTFWARFLTFGAIHTLIAKAEHSRQVLHETLEDLGQHEMDLRAELRRTEARVAQVKHAGKEVEEMLLMLFDIELLRGCVDEWYVPEPEYVPPPVLTEEPMAEGRLEPEWFVAGKPQVGAGAHGLWMSRCWNVADSFFCMSGCCGRWRSDRGRAKP